MCVRIAAIRDLPSRLGDFQMVAFYNNRDEEEHAAFIHEDVCDAENVPLRVHSECLTSDAIGYLWCDCRDQLEESLRVVGKAEKGVVLYLRQEGGYQFVNNIRAYGLQDHGYDTVEANIALGFRDDEREYGVAAHMIQSPKIKSIKLLTNNPLKINELSQYGIKITERVPLIIPPNPSNRFYLETKATKSGHLIDVNGKDRLLEQGDRPIVEGATVEQITSLHGA